MPSFETGLGLSRRQLILGALGTASCMMLPGAVSSLNLARPETLYVDTARGLSLSLGTRVGRDQPRPWSWRMFYADALTGNPDAELSEQDLEKARARYSEYSGRGSPQTKFDHAAFLDFLDQPHPLSGSMTLSRQWEEYLTRTSSFARASDLIDEILKLQESTVSGPCLEVLDVDMQLSSAGKCIWLTEPEGVRRLRAAVIKLRLPLRIAVV